MSKTPPARLVEAAGAAAVATTSAGVSWSVGAAGGMLARDRAVDLIGVQRINVGMAIAQAAYALTDCAARELLTRGTYGLLDGGLDHRQLNALLAARSPADGR